MNIALQQVLEFHKAFKLSIGDPRDPCLDTDLELRYALINEEFGELTEALFDNTLALSEQDRLIKVADALGDLVYTITGAAISWGIDLAGVFDAIHISNMSKLVGGNCIKDSAGKVLKGPAYEPPDIQGALDNAAREVQHYGYSSNEDDTAWWPEPTVAHRRHSKSYDERDVISSCEPPQEISDRIMIQAKDQAKILAMKNIKQDFVPGVKSNGHTVDNRAYTIVEAELDAIPEEIFEDASTKPHVSQGIMTSYGAFVFSCPCGRTQGVQARLGSRGGMAKQASCECMCGRAFDVQFPLDAAPEIKVTTIEERGRLA